MTGVHFGAAGALVPPELLSRDQLKTLVRDINSLAALGAVKVERLGEGRYRLGVRVEWPTEGTETAFFEKLKQPCGKRVAHRGGRASTRMVPLPRCHVA